MTKKDYTVLAAALRDARIRVSDNPDVKFGIDMAEQEILAVLRTDNPRFDRDRFLKASGYGEVLSGRRS